MQRDPSLWPTMLCIGSALSIACSDSPSPDAGSGAETEPLPEDTSSTDGGDSEADTETSLDPTIPATSATSDSTGTTTDDPSDWPACPDPLPVGTCEAAGDVSVDIGLIEPAPGTPTLCEVLAQQMMGPQLVLTLDCGDEDDPIGGPYLPEGFEVPSLVGEVLELSEFGFGGEESMGGFLLTDADGNTRLGWFHGGVYQTLTGDQADGVMPPLAIDAVPDAGCPVEHAPCFESRRTAIELSIDGESRVSFGGEIFELGSELRYRIAVDDSIEEFDCHNFADGGCRVEGAEEGTIVTALLVVRI